MRLPAGSPLSRGSVAGGYGTSLVASTDPGTVFEGSQESYQPTRVLPYVSTDPGLGKRPTSHGCWAGRLQATSESQVGKFRSPNPSFGQFLLPWLVKLLTVKAAQSKAPSCMLLN